MAPVPCPWKTILCRRQRHDVSSRAQVDGLRALAHAVRLDVERHLLAIDEGAQARRLDRRDMHEHVLRAAVGRDETKAFGRVEKFYCTGLGHGRTPSPVASLVPGPPLRPAGRSGYVLAVMHSRMNLPPAKAGPSDIHSFGERVDQTFQSPGQQTPERWILWHGTIVLTRCRTADAGRPISVTPCSNVRRRGFAAPLEARKRR